LLPLFSLPLPLSMTLRDKHLWAWGRSVALRYIHPRWTKSSCMHARVARDSPPMDVRFNRAAVHKKQFQPPHVTPPWPTVFVIIARVAFSFHFGIGISQGPERKCHFQSTESVVLRSFFDFCLLYGIIASSLEKTRLEDHNG